jgi:hypothetical protein
MQEKKDVLKVARNFPLQEKKKVNNNPDYLSTKMFLVKVFTPLIF